ncbi:MAG TPA: DUF1559 domain-containing protein [Caulifigura sp.]|nr:DUF1559 domain-containing protein [Caulifigura sp.]
MRLGRLLRFTGYALAAFVAIKGIALGVHAYKVAGAPKADLDDIKTIAKAMSAYRDKHGKLPPAVLYDPASEVGHSWRVALLPELGYQMLYDEYNRNEPWDSDHNRQVLARMPDVYRSSMSPSDSTVAAYFVMVGPTTAFATSDGLSDPEITDGWDSLVTVVSARRDIPWTKPADIEFDDVAPLPELGGFHEGVFHMATASGDGRTVSLKVGATLLKQMINSCDGLPSSCF